MRPSVLFDNNDKADFVVFKFLHNNTVYILCRILYVLLIVRRDENIMKTKTQELGCF